MGTDMKKLFWKTEDGCWEVKGFWGFVALLACTKTLYFLRPGLYAMMGWCIGTMIGFAISSPDSSGSMVFRILVLLFTLLIATLSVILNALVEFDRQRASGALKKSKVVALYPRKKP
jgi:hypothetical protein